MCGTAGKSEEKKQLFPSSRHWASGRKEAPADYQAARGGVSVPITFQSGICFSIERLREIIHTHNISIALLTVPAEAAQQMAKVLISSGIKGILNFTTVNINVPKEIYLEEYDMITSLEKVAYFVKDN